MGARGCAGGGPYRFTAPIGRKLLASTAQGPATFFEASWARDFVTMSARTTARSA
jgi:hypothetical protein